MSSAVAPAARPDAVSAVRPAAPAPREEPEWLVDWFQYQSLPDVKPAMARALLLQRRETDRDEANPGGTDPGGTNPGGTNPRETGPGETIRRALRTRPENAGTLRAARMRAEATLAFCAREGIRVFLPLYDAWPAFAVLRDAPLQLFVEGTVPAGPLLAVAGTREPDESGLERIQALIPEAASLGVGLVTGIARGVDREAQEVANALAMPSVAVRAGCLREPLGEARARTLRTLLDQGGAQISEGWPQQRSLRYAFVRRNRLVTALGVGLLVVQARARGGTVQAAEAALRQGRPVAFPAAALESERSTDEGLRALVAEHGATLALPGLRPPLTMLGEDRPLGSWLAEALAEGAASSDGATNDCAANGDGATNDCAANGDGATNDCAASGDGATNDCAANGDGATNDCAANGALSAPASHHPRRAAHSSREGV